jgi:hypothetical protein
MMKLKGLSTIEIEIETLNVPTQTSGRPRKVWVIELGYKPGTST